MNAKSHAAIAEPAARDSTETGSASRFTIVHGLAASLVLHASLCLPFLSLRSAPPPEEDDTLVVEMNGAVSDSQTEEKQQEDTKGETPQVANNAAATQEKQVAEDHPQSEIGEEAKETPVAQNTPPTEERRGATGAADVKGAEQAQVASTVARRQVTEEDLIRAYLKGLSKRIQARLVIPAEGRRAGWKGVARVSFVVLPTGDIRPETLSIAGSSGQAALDDGALRTVRASVPFTPPPKEMRLVVGVVYGPTKK